MRGRRALLALAALVPALAGCGIGAGGAPAGVQLLVTQDFGTRTVLQTDRPGARGGETVMRLLERNARIATRYGGGFVQTIDGLSGGHRAGRPVDWFYYVNGIEADMGAAATIVHSGDRIWWDRHDWGATMKVPAVIGSYPEPFRHGTGGRRLPVRVECGAPGDGPCRTVTRALQAAGVPAAEATVATTPGPNTLRVLVGPWRTLAPDAGAAGLERGPEVSGVYARMSADGRALTLLDQRARPVRRLGPASGLVAASKIGDAGPFWIVTGTDDAGVVEAARAFAAGESALEGKFALAVSQDRGIGLPVVRP